jgi:hypothetical protein
LRHTATFNNKGIHPCNEVAQITIARTYKVTLTVEKVDYDVLMLKLAM